MPGYTPEQQRAIEVRGRDVAVLAGAGSGKTSVLVGRYLALLRANPEWPVASVVAITFTDKAAREMRARIRQEVAWLAAEGLDRAFWTERQSTLDSARVSTIHSLCGLLLRANAAELGMDPAFRTLDEADSALLRAEAVQDALVRIANSPAAPLFEQYETRELRAALLSALDWDLPPTPDPDALWTAWEREFVERMRAVIATLQADSAFIEALEWTPNPLPPDDDLIAKVLYKVQSRRTDILSSVPMLVQSRLRLLLSDIQLKGGKADAWGGSAKFEDAKARLKWLRTRADDAIKQIGDLTPALDGEVARLLPLWYSAIQTAQDVYRETKRSQSAFDFADLERLTRTVLQSEGVRERYRAAEFNYLLVDEFQDTNDAQRDIVYALTGDAGRLFIVGDVKQSIYAFRGAQVNVFREVQRDITARGGEAVSLARSFRTHHALVEWVNRLFAPLLDSYEPMIAHRPTPDDFGPCVALTLIDEAQIEKVQGRADQLRAWEAHELAKRIASFVTSGRKVWDKARGEYREAQYGDFAILVRTYKNMPFIEDALRDKRITVVTNAGRGYYGQQEIRDLLNLLAALYNPANNLTLAAALRSPLFSLRDDTLLMLRLDSPKTLWSALMAAVPDSLADPDAVRFAQTTLSALAALAGRVTVAALIGAVLDQTAFCATLTALPNGGRTVNNVEKLREIARESDTLSLGEFLETLDSLSEVEAREAEAPIETEGAVQVMTVHAAKGLEFPVVALFACSEEPNRPPQTLLFDRRHGLLCDLHDEAGKSLKPYMWGVALRDAEPEKAQEALRLFYVAATRAGDYLWLSGAWSNGQQGTWLAAALSQATGEMIEQTLVSEPPVELFAPPRGLAESAWERLAENSATPEAPPLIARIPPPDLTATLAASELGALGEADALGAEGQRAFRDYVQHDMPGMVEAPLIARQKRPVSGRLIGEIVHDALRWMNAGAPPQTVIRAFAWERGITGGEALDYAVTETLALIEKTQHSEIWGRVARAQDIYREYPFSFRFEGRLINGKIDVLFLDEYGNWVVLDYKSDHVRGLRVADHAQRYAMQVGIYAAAVEAAIGQPPQTLLHYLRLGYTHTLPEADWRAALQRITPALIETLED